MRPILITDLDNTIYNWVDYYAPSFRAMVHALSRELKADEGLLLEDFKKVFQKHGTVEYAFSIQELDYCKGLSVEKIENLVRIGKGAFTHVRDYHLKPYDDVVKTLEWANANNILVIAVTNAPLFHAKMRLRQLRLDKYFYGLAAWEGNTIPNNDFTSTIREKEANNAYQTKIFKYWALKQEELKPNPFGYLRVINDLKTSHKVTYVIGDSLTKDIKPAIEIGAISIFASYGTIFSTKNFETILKITHWDNQHIKVAYETDTISPTFTVERFSSLMDILVPQQISLF